MMTHKMSWCICVFWCWFCCGSVCLVCLFAFLWFVLMGPLTGLCIGQLPVLLRLSTCRWPCMILHFFWLQLNVCNDLTKAMKALDGKNPVDHEAQTPLLPVMSEGAAVHCEVVYVPEMPAHPIQMFDSSRGPMPSSYHQWLLSGCSRRRVMASIAASTAPLDSSDRTRLGGLSHPTSKGLDFTKRTAEVSVLESLPD